MILALDTPRCAISGYCLNQLKIDQSFICNIDAKAKDALIVTTILAIADHLNLNVLTEGVEDKEQLAMLIEKGCNQFQGYYFSKPKTAAQLSHYLCTHQRNNNT